MRNNGYALGQNGPLVRPAQDGMTPAMAAPTIKEIPYDYVATFKLDGQKPGNRVQGVINISTDGAFVAVAIGYSFIPAQLPAAPPISSDPDAPPGLPASPNDTVNWLFKNVILSAAAINDPRVLMQCLLVRLCGIDFKYSIIDSGAGRELQNLAIHNIAGLGEPNGERPFRPFAKPMMFMPRSTIRIEIEEISTGPLYKDAQLFIVLHGYKMLGYGMGQP